MRLVLHLYSHVYFKEEQMSKFHEVLMESMLHLPVVVRRGRSWRWRTSSGRTTISFFEKVLFFFLPVSLSSPFLSSHSFLHFLPSFQSTLTWTQKDKKRRVNGSCLFELTEERERARTCVSAKIFVVKFSQSLLYHSEESGRRWDKRREGKNE